MYEYDLGDCAIVGCESVVAGKKTYKTDVVEVPLPMFKQERMRRVNHIDRECDNCAAIGEMTIELQTESACCPICGHRQTIEPADIVEDGIYIDDCTA